MSVLIGATEADDGGNNVGRAGAGDESLGCAFRLDCFAVLAVASFAVPDGTIPSWLKEIPPPWRLGLDTAISSFMKWLVEDATFGLFTFRTRRARSVLPQCATDRGNRDLLDRALRGSGSTAVQLAPPLPLDRRGWGRGGAGYRFGGTRLRSSLEAPSSTSPCSASGQAP